MSDQWFCYIGDREYGPFTPPQLREFVAQGRLTAEHFVRPGSSDQWLPAGQVPGLFPVPPTPLGMQEVPLARPAPRPLEVPPGPQLVDQPMSRRPAVSMGPAVPMGPAVTAAPAVPQRVGEAPLRPLQVPTAPASRLPTVSAGPAPAAASPPVAASRPGWSAPAGVPMALPATPAAPGQPVGVPLTSGLPVGTAVAAAGGPPYAAAVPAAHGAPPNPERSELRRKRTKANSEQLLLLVGLGGAGLLVLGILIVMAIVYSQPVQAPRGRSTAPVAAAKKPKAKPVVESNPSNTARRQVDPATLKGVDLATMSIWMDASKQSGGGLRNVARILFSGAWRDATGSSRPCLKIELRIQNTSGDILNLRSWHAETQPTDPFAAIAIDDDNQPLTPAAGRRGSVPRRLRPNETVTEQLAFEMPPGGSAVRLVVPFAVFGQNGQLGFKIPQAAITDRAPSELIEGLGMGRGLVTDQSEPLLDLKVDGQLPAVTPPESQPGLPDMADMPKPAEKPETPAEKKAGGGEDDEDLPGLMNEDEKPAPKEP